MKLLPKVPQLVDAIEAMSRLAYEYHDTERIGEPQCYGIGAKGGELLRVYQIRGGSTSLELLQVTKIKNLKVLDSKFSGPGPKYSENDKAMVYIFAQLKPKKKP
jgi:hypothetical protein